MTTIKGNRVDVDILNQKLSIDALDIVQVPYKRTTTNVEGEQRKALRIENPFLGYIVLDDKSENALNEEINKQINRELDERKRKEDAIEGLTLLKQEINKHEYFNYQIRRMQDDENLILTPTPPTSDINALARQYPLAALYLKAEHLEVNAYYYNQRQAAQRTQEAILGGATLEDAKKIAQDWEPGDGILEAVLGLDLAHID
ncbi:hypothetical protein [Tolypothrix tenuis]|uniref:hypothetical protein n=1 Tax=Tolypothrix tenuis TaxID=457083 RepID=UPI0016867059